MIVRPAASDALLPGLDQTRTVGLVTLPGAFVGMLLGGAISGPCDVEAVRGAFWFAGKLYGRVVAGMRGRCLVSDL